jgi:uncharacterized protein
MLIDKLEPLKRLFTEMERALIAYSGGIDSTLVAKVAYDVLGDRALAITAVSPSLLPEDLEDARVQAAEIGIAHELVQTTKWIILTTRRIRSIAAISARVNCTTR